MSTGVCAGSVSLLMLWTPSDMLHEKEYGQNDKKETEEKKNFFFICACVIHDIAGEDSSGTKVT